MRLRHIFLSAAIVLLPHVAVDVFACQCRESQPPCAQYWEADAVFVGSVTNVLPSDDPQSVDKATEYKIGFERVNFNVERAFRGVAGNNVELMDWMSSCRYGFKAGKRYLVYAYYNPANKTLSTHTCSRTAEISEAGDDLDYIAGLRTRKPEQLILGILADRDKKLANVEVMAQGEKKSYRSASNEKGWFKIAVAEPGRYVVRITLPHNSDVIGTEEQLDRISSRVRTDKNTILEYVVDVQTGRCAFIDVPLFVE